jgi:rusticyanin
MIPRRIAVLVGATAVAAAGLGAGIGFAASGSGSLAQAPAGATRAASYSWYKSMMGRYFGGSSMMGGSGGYGWMMGGAGYRWMLGGSSAPGWMRGAALPASMMGTSADPGKLMGRLWATAPGPRVSPEHAARRAGQAPVGARIDTAARTIIFTTRSVRLVVAASPAGGPDETFRIAGMVDPKIVVPAGAHVRIEVINADADTAHGLVITASRGQSSWMPMMTSRPAFPGAAAWFLGDPTTAGLHAATLAFTAGTPGSYRYLCPVPGHAARGMTGDFTVSARS